MLWQSVLSLLLSDYELVSHWPLWSVKNQINEESDQSLPTMNLVKDTSIFIVAKISEKLEEVDFKGAVRL